MRDTPIPVRYDLPIPEGKAGTGNDRLRQTLRAMLPGGSFEWPNYSHPRAIGIELGIRIKGRKLNGNGYTIWKLSDLQTRAAGPSCEPSRDAPCVTPTIIPVSPNPEQSQR